MDTAVFVPEMGVVVHNGFWHRHGWLARAWCGVQFLVTAQCAAQFSTKDCARQFALLDLEYLTVEHFHMHTPILHALRHLARCSHWSADLSAVAIKAPRTSGTTPAGPPVCGTARACLLEATFNVPSWFCCIHITPEFGPHSTISHPWHGAPPFHACLRVGTAAGLVLLLFLDCPDPGRGCAPLAASPACGLPVLAQSRIAHAILDRPGRVRTSKYRIGF